MATVKVTVDQRAVLARTTANDKRDAMRAGVVLRAQTFRSGKEYRRRDKHRVDLRGAQS